ncbi:DNA recombination protein RmuC [Helicobacter muridarum]|uniref:DNA recombination protein n=2 Tax=Helicobacter muridarum TaxID=216 RepID=A0A377PS90_9HELI|nr:DNA recombination protein RmuC [Helicobacter muridarum]STQ85272.1 DNA recombination protein [Helicobacter muridarum]
MEILLDQPTITTYAMLGVVIILAILYVLQKNNIANLKRNLRDIQEDSMSKQYNANLLIQELKLREQHNIDMLNLAQADNQRLHEEFMHNIESLKQEYEYKLKDKDNALQESYIYNSKQIQELQESHKIELQERLSKALKEQEEKLNAQYQIQQEELKGTLAIEREKQEALMMQRFYEISDSLLEQRGNQFQEKQALSLKPLTEEILRFKNEIAQNTKENQEKQTSLITEIRLLKEANDIVSKEANNLANIMKGDSKKQGQWGEVVLERILENSGLEKDREYYLQATIKDDNQQNLRPDAIIHLPNNRLVVVDSKVSLSAYIEYSNADNSTEKERYLKSHLDSIKSHIKNLSTKSYQDHTKGNRLDFVIMFLPSEGAYNEILREDMKIFIEAYQKGIVISAPTTLMVILRLIDYLWKNEARDKNTEKILDECLKLIKKFDGFKESMEKIERSLESAKAAYQKADTQLNGRGSISSYIGNLNNYMSKISKKDLEEKDYSNKDSSKNNSNMEAKSTDSKDKYYQIIDINQSIKEVL